VDKRGRVEGHGGDQNPLFKAGRGGMAGGEGVQRWPHGGSGGPARCQTATLGR
jgi:hypothetical protein